MSMLTRFLSTEAGEQYETTSVKPEEQTRPLSVDVAKVRIEMLRRAGSVERMHCVRPLVQQRYSVAEHTYNAMIIGRELCLINLRDPACVLSRLLLHDAPEVMTGDMPANVKRVAPEAEAAMRKLEADFNKEWELNEPEVRHLRMQKVPRSFYTDLDHAIYKAADYLELGWFCLVERRMGNGYSAGEQSVEGVFWNVMDYVREFEWVPGVREMAIYLRSEWEKAK